MAFGTYSLNVNIGGIVAGQQITREGNHPNPYEVQLPLAVAGEFKDVDNNAANVELPADHGLDDGAGTFDVYWTDNGAKLRYVVDGDVDAANNVMELANGSGDGPYPANNTACQVSAVTEINTSIDGDESKLMSIAIMDPTNPSTKPLGHVQFVDVGGAEIAEVDLRANEPRVWDLEGGDNNEFTGNVIRKAYASANSTAQAQGLKILSLEDA
jgi:hypothetical protein